MKTVLASILLLFFCGLHAQKKYVDSLYQNFWKAVSNQEKIDALEIWLPISIQIHHPKTQECLKILKQIAEKTDNTFAHGVYYLNYAHYLTEYLGDYDSGYKNVVKAKDIFEELNAEKQLGYSYNRLAFIVLWNELGKKNKISFKENLYDDYLSKALKIARKIGDPNLEVLTLGFIGSYYNVTEGNTQKALNFFLEAEKLFSEKVTPENRLIILGSICIVYADMKNEPEMLKYLKKSEKEEFFYSSDYSSNNIYRAIAKFYFNQNDKESLQKAKSFAQSAYQISKRMNAPEYLSQNSQLLYQIFKKLGDQGNALKFLEEHNVYDQKFTNERLQRTMMEFDNAKKERTIVEQKLQLFQREIVIFISFALFLLGILFSYLFFTNYKKKQKLQYILDVQKAETKERRRIASELHDNLGVQANAILYNSNKLLESSKDREIAANLNETSKQMLGNLRETVWALKKNQMNGTEIWLRIIDFMKQMQKNYHEINFKFSGGLGEEHQLSSAKSLHLILIVKEAVHNAIKHSDAVQIEVYAQEKDGKWVLTVSDNGKGFELIASTNISECNGIANMKERAKSADFDLDILPNPDTGTMIKIEINNFRV